MKRIIGLVLCVAMLLSMASVGISASYQEHIAVSGSSQTIDGVSYTIVKTAAELTSALTSGKKIMLANNIALTSASPITIKVGTLLDGNGYAITYSGTLTSSLFVLGAGGSEITIRNTQFGSGAAPMTTSGNIGLFAETVGDNGTQVRVIWQNNTFYISNSGAVTEKAGGLFETTTMVHKFSGCTVNANIDATGVSLVGAWIGSASGELHFNDCSVTGNVKGSYGVGGFVGQNTSGRAYFENCVNHATIVSTGYCGGFSGNAGTSVSQLYFLNCTNYGSVTTSGSGYGGMAGGIIGRISNTITYDRANHGFYGCSNYGSIQSNGSAGGIVGRHHEYDSSTPQYLYFDGCFNAAYVRGSNYSGGIVGAVSPVVTETVIKNCANIGRVSAGSGYSGNFGGLLSGAKLTDCYGVGYITATSAKNRGVVAGMISGNYTVSTGPSAGTTMTIVSPVLSNVRFLTNLSSSYYQSATLVTDATMADFLADMKSAFGMNFVRVTSGQSTVGGYLTIADPQIRGVQQSVAPAAGTTDLRFAAIINTVDAYESIGFRTIVRTNGQSIRIDRTTQTVYTALNATSANGTVSAITAKSLSGQYLTAVTFTNIPTSGDVSLEITPYAISKTGEEYTGKTRVIVVSKGAPKTETMMLNGVPLEKFSIVYPNASSNNEKMLAERLAAKIGTLLGHTVTCYSDSTAKRANEILIGRTNRYTPSVSGRWIFRPDEANGTVVLTATGTTALSEVVEYFLEKLVETRANGLSSWRISGSISVPIDQQVSIMAYNTGAKEDSAILAAEWNRIVDTLPDIFTMQEPWASFLATFFNNYAVKPSTKFVSSNKNTMSTSVNNKAFTGNGYYGVYWGQPRWKSGDAHQTGAASYSPILYAKDRFTVNTSKSGTFWLSNTPATSGSMLSGSDHVRCATYATLTDKNTNETFVVVNVHLDFVTDVQTQQINILLTQLKNKVGSNIPIIITGDMNANPTNTAMDTYFNNGWKAAENIADVSLHNNTTIDWILVNNTSWIKAQRYEYQCEKTFYNGLWNTVTQWGMPSDHPAVYAELTINTGKTRPGANTEKPPVAAHAFGAWTKDPTTSDSHYRECECGDREVGMCTWELTETIIKATHLVEGKEVYTCSACGRTETRTIEKIATHSFTAWKPLANANDGHYHDCACGLHEEAACDWVLIRTLKAASMFEEGLATFRCSVCQRTEDRVLPKLPFIEVDESNQGSGAPTVGTDPSTNMGKLELIG